MVLCGANLYGWGICVQRYYGNERQWWENRGVPILGSTNTFDELENTFEVMSILHAHRGIVLSPRARPTYGIGVEEVPITKGRRVGNVLTREGDGADHPRGGDGHQ